MVGLEVLASPDLEEVRKEKLTERGLHQESTITLYRTNYNGVPQVSAFIHPTEYDLNEHRINNIDYNFTEARKIIRRDFKDTSLEDLNSKFLNDARPCIAFMTHDYTLNKPRVIEHSFVKDAGVYLEKVISDLKA